MSAQHSHHDVIVVGGRCAGAATAMLLARQGHDVLVVDKADLPSDTLSTHGIARGGVVQLSRWGLLDEVLASGAPAITGVEFHLAGQQITRRVKDRAGVDVLVAPRRHRLDEILAGAAVRSGATVRTAVTATGVIRDPAGRVTGIAGRSRTGRVELSARYVVGADGLRSRMAGHFDAAEVDRFTSDSSLFYTYVRGVDWRGFEFHLAPGAFGGVFPTHDGEACVWLCRPAPLAAAVIGAGCQRASALRAELDAALPSLAARIRAGRFTAPVRGAVRLPNIIREAAGPGWALVGDAGYHRDPITGHGITDAFRDAELLATALDRSLKEPSAEAEALTDFARTRDALLRETYDLTRALTRFPEPALFAELQIQLADAIEREARLLAALPAASRGEVVLAA